MDCEWRTKILSSYDGIDQRFPEQMPGRQA